MAEKVVGNKSLVPVVRWGRVLAGIAVVAFLVTGCATEPHPKNLYRDIEMEMLSFDEVHSQLQRDLTSDYKISAIELPQLECRKLPLSGCYPLMDDDEWLERFADETFAYAKVAVMTEDRKIYEYEVALVDEKPKLFILPNSKAPDPQELLHEPGK
jgi:hypothetical protein